MAQNTQGNQNGKVKGFYGWFIVVACFLLSASSTGLLTNLNSLFITPAIETLKVNHSTFMLFTGYVCLYARNSLYRAFIP